MASQKEVIKKFMEQLKLNTSSDPLDKLNSAVAGSSSSLYSSINQVISELVIKCASASSYESFLLDECGIDLANLDTGAISGKDAGGIIEKTPESIVPESDISNWSMPTSTIETINGLTINYPTLSGLTAVQEFIIGALHTWWIKNSLDIIKTDFGYAFDNSTASPTEITVMFSNEGLGLLAHVDWYWDSTYPSTGKCIILNLVINMDMYDNIDITNPNGKTIVSGYNVPYLDRTIIHEFVHAVHAANILFFPDLATNAKWFTEGSAELIHGIDDKRYDDIVALASDSSRLNNAFITSGIDAYSAGYILLRYYAKKVSEGSSSEDEDIDIDSKHIMVERGIAYSLQDLIEKFLIFAQKSENEVQSWQLVDDRLDSFYGATLKVPMRNKARKVASSADILSDTVTLEYPYFYVSFQHTNVTETTYANWLYTGCDIDDYNTVFFAKEEAANPNLKHWYLSERFDHSITRKGYPTVTIDRAEFPNMFANNGEFVAVGLHTLFDENLWMCEQGGITCVKESMVEENTINLMGGNARTSSVPRAPLYSWTILPSFPGTGCPWFTLSNDNKRLFSTEIHGFEYWFTKGNYDATITIKYHNRQRDDDVYQSMSFGMLDTFLEESYIFPLFIGGGNQALRGSVKEWSEGDPPHPVYVSGTLYDLDILNIGLSNSNLLYPTRFCDADTSNFRILTPSGDWESIYSMSQAMVDKSPCPLTTLRAWYDTPSYDIDAKLNTTLPQIDDTRDLLDTYMITEERDAYKSSSMIGDIIIFMHQLGVDYHGTGAIGKLPNSFWYASRTLPPGEVKLDGKLYLSIPNGWENRLIYYPLGYICSGLNDPDYSGGAFSNSGLRAYYDHLWSYMYKYRFTHRLLIRLDNEED